MHSSLETLLKAIPHDFLEIFELRQNRTQNSTTPLFLKKSFRFYTHKKRRLHVLKKTGIYITSKALSSKTSGRIWLSNVGNSPLSTYNAFKYSWVRSLIHSHQTQSSWLWDSFLLSRTGSAIACTRNEDENYHRIRCRMIIEKFFSKL